jgi:hypothetical protein
MEKREGRFDRHFAAQFGNRRHFGKDEVTEAFIAYFAGRPMPAEVSWATMNMPEPGSLRTGAHAGARFLLGIVPFALLGIVIVWKWWR